MYSTICNLFTYLFNKLLPYLFDDFFVYSIVYLANKFPIYFFIPDIETVSPHSTMSLERDLFALCDCCWRVLDNLQSKGHHKEDFSHLNPVFIIQAHTAITPWAILMVHNLMSNPERFQPTDYSLQTLHRANCFFMWLLIHWLYRPLRTLASFTPDGQSSFYPQLSHIISCVFQAPEFVFSQVCFTFCFALKIILFTLLCCIIITCCRFFLLFNSVTSCLILILVIFFHSYRSIHFLENFLSCKF